MLSHIARRGLLSVANLFCSVAPPTRVFSTKAALYRLSGVDIARSSQVVGRARIGFNNVAIGRNTWVGMESLLLSSVQGRIAIGSEVDIGPRVIFNTGTHVVGPASRRAGDNVGANISIGDGTWIGMGAMILAGTSLGKGCVVAAGSVCRGEYPDNSLIAGAPAVVKRYLDT